MFCRKYSDKLLSFVFKNLLNSILMKNYFLCQKVTFQIFIIEEEQQSIDEDCLVRDIWLLFLSESDPLKLDLFVIEVRDKLLSMCAKLVADICDTKTIFVLSFTNEGWLHVVNPLLKSFSCHLSHLWIPSDFVNVFLLLNSDSDFCCWRKS